MFNPPTDGHRDRLPLRVGDRRFLPDFGAFARRPIPAMRQMVDQGILAGEQSLSVEAIWKRHAGDFVLGAGQTWFDLEEEASRRRFRSSEGIDPWTRRELNLLHATELKTDITSSMDLSCFGVGEYLYLIDGLYLSMTNDPSDDQPLFVNVNAATAAAISSITTNGAYIFFTDGSTIFRAGVGSVTATSYSTQDAELVAYGNGRLFAANNGSIYEITDAGATATELFDHVNGSWSWDCFAGTPHGMYIGGHSGDVSEIYMIGVVETTGALAAPYIACQLPQGETIKAMCWYGGVMVLATSRGIRLALPSQSGFLTYGPLISINDNHGLTGYDGVSALEPQGEYVWFSWHDYDAATTGLGRLSLARFTEELVPAYAADIMAVAQGEVTGIATWRDKRFFMVNGTGLYGEVDAYVVEATLRSGRITFGTTERKAFTSIELRHDPLPAGATIEATITTDSGSSYVLGVSSITDAVGVVLTTDQEIEAEWVELTLVIVRGDDEDLSVGLNWWTLRAVPLPFMAEEILIPVHLRSQVDWNGQTIGLVPWEDWSYLHDLAARRARVPYELGTDKAHVYVAGLSIENEGDGVTGLDANQFDQWVEGTWTLRLVTISE